MGVGAGAGARAGGGCGVLGQRSVTTVRHGGGNFLSFLSFQELLGWILLELYRGLWTHIEDG